MIKYYKLLDTLSRRSMTKEDLHQQIGISPATIFKISAHKAVSLDVIDKTCCALNCQPGDIIEYVPAASAEELLLIREYRIDPDWLLIYNQTGDEMKSGHTATYAYLSGI